MRSAVRAYDYLVLAVAAFGSVFAYVAERVCGPSNAVSVLLFAVLVVALGVPQGRLGYGSPLELASLAVAAAAAGLTQLAFGASGDACALDPMALWTGALGLMLAPRLAVACGRREPARWHDAWQVLPAATSGDFGRTAWILTHSRPVDEPRVRRQAAALHAAGWNVVAIGYRGVAPKPDFWTLIELPLNPRRPNRGALLRILNLERANQWLALMMARFSAFHAEKFYWTRFDRGLIDDILAAAASRGVSCDLIANHDFYTLPMAAELSAGFSVPITTDVHEYARGQYMHQLSFRLFHGAYVHSLQEKFFPQVALLTVVCKGIADLLSAEYRLQRPPIVVRNVSVYEPMPFRPSGEVIEVLYHGMLFPERGLEETIRSLPLWRPEFVLVLRGSGEADYVESLKRLARKVGAGHRLRIEPAVPLPDLVRVANRCDIGFFASADYSPQKMFTAPNKLFEYVMAGLALCVSDLPEMRRVVQDHGVGSLFASLDPAEMAKAINGFTRQSIDHYKRKSLEAAKVLCWGAEQQQLIDAYEEIYRSTRHSRSGQRQAAVIA